MAVILNGIEGAYLQVNLGLRSTPKKVFTGDRDA